MFVDCYLQSFNATKSAIIAEYSKKTARQQGHKLLTNVYIKEKIQHEMESLRDLMKDEGLRSFSMFLNIALETEGKLQKHNEAEEQIDASKVRRMADAIDGCKKDMKEKKRILLKELDDLNAELFALNYERVRLGNQRANYKAYYLDNKEWERLQNLKKTLFQDILDCGGFKATDKNEYSGKDSSPLSLIIKL